MVETVDSEAATEGTPLYVEKRFEARLELSCTASASCRSAAVDDAVIVQKGVKDVTQQPRRMGEAHRGVATYTGGHDGSRGIE